MYERATHVPGQPTMWRVEGIRKAWSTEGQSVWFEKIDISPDSR